MKRYLKCKLLLWVFGFLAALCNLFLYEGIFWWFNLLFAVFTVCVFPLLREEYNDANKKEIDIIDHLIERK